jgi:radical SAM protein with 4Fe4S-binding SPASM domain
MCGRRKMEKQHPELCDWGDMPIELLKKIAVQIPPGVTVQLHWNGEPLLYPDLEKAVMCFPNHFLHMDTNGKLLMERVDEIYVDSIAISIVQDDPEGDEQLDIAEKFIERRYNEMLVVLRTLGKIDADRMSRIKDLSCRYPRVVVAIRQLHAPAGSFGYEKPVVKPETGVCLEMLHKLAIDRFGDVSPCVRYDPFKQNRLANVESEALADVWTGGRRKEWVDYHVTGRRDMVPLCAGCDFWGCPNG